MESRLVWRRYMVKTALGCHKSAWIERKLARLGREEKMVCIEGAKMLVRVIRRHTFWTYLFKHSGQHSCGIALSELRSKTGR